MKKVTAIVLLAITASLVAFQNCSGVEFTDVASDPNSKSDFEVGEQEDPVPPENDDPPIPGDETPGDEDTPGEEPNVEFACAEDNINDVRVNIAQVIVGDQVVNSLTGVRSLKTLSAGFGFTTTNALSSSQVRLVLHAENNQVVSVSNVSYALKTPSAQQSGVKINLGGSSRHFKANSGYIVKFAFDPDFQVVRAGKKCLLKPVLRATSVAEAEF